MSFEVVLTNEAEKFPKKCDKSIRNRIIDKLEYLCDNPKLGKPLTTNLTGLWSLRVGDYKAIYQIKNNELIIGIIKIVHRKNIYD